MYRTRAQCADGPDAGHECRQSDGGCSSPARSAGRSEKLEGGFRAKLGMVPVCAISWRTSDRFRQLQHGAGAKREGTARERERHSEREV